MKELPKKFKYEYDIRKARIIVPLFFGGDVYYSESRIPLADVPEGFYRYEVRGKDKDGSWGCLEKQVIVNFVATIISDHEIPPTSEATLSSRHMEWTDILSYAKLSDFED